MRIAVTSNGKNISSDFNETIKFVVFEILKGRTRGKFVIDVSASGGYDALRYILKNEGVEVILCGEITDKIKIDLENHGIKVISGVRGTVNNAITGYMRKQIKEE